MGNNDRTAYLLLWGQALSGQSHRACPYDFLNILAYKGMMEPGKQTTLTAFLEALTQMEESLPDDVQQRLHGVAYVLQQTGVEDLHELAAKYPPFYDIYLQKRNQLLQQEGERDKNQTPPPPPPNQEFNSELENMAVSVFSAEDSVAAAQASERPNLLQKIRNWLTGNR
jgi:hypothetical protein